MAKQDAAINEIKKHLLARLEELSTRVDEIESTIREPVSPDFEERANDYDTADALKGLEQAALREVTQIHAALKRIEQGVYGECQTCGSDIGEKRLKAVPYATQCIDCAG